MAEETSTDRLAEDLGRTQDEVDKIVESLQNLTTIIVDSNLMSVYSTENIGSMYTGLEGIRESIKEISDLVVGKLVPSLKIAAEGKV